ncbi:MAG: pantetheine-phosphate adenylyltransferase [Muribaculaceae bacterium]|nr:pantetheine-phosphate adenylyltransferase [Muribaculaceae bacterium]MDE6703701.1 pantetheine-phosphate adenylyltransferase [Muribaculaceae bacterium]
MTAKSSSNKKRIAFFAGSFDPFTIGHASIVERGLAIFDEIVIGIGINSLKTSAEEAERRARHIIRLYETEPRVKVVTYSGLTVDAARDEDASCLLRGVRSVKDFEYERDMADINRQLSGLETVLLYSLPEHSAVSSSVVRELQAFGKDASRYLPD